MAVCLIGSFDTKGEDLEYIRQELEKYGHTIFAVDTSIIGDHSYRVDVSAGEVAESGGFQLKELREKNDRGSALGIMRTGLEKIVEREHKKSTFQGVIGAGGGAGTSVISAAMRKLPIGVPKVLISTLASGQTEMYIQQSDIIMVPSLVDIAGVNRISAGVYRRGAAALAGMMRAGFDTGMPADEKPIIAATMFGNTTAAVEACKRKLEEKRKFEPIIFHATGTGGKTMEHLIRQGYISGVLDITVTELADEIACGVMSAGATRLEAAGEKGIPQVVVPGCVDMVNFWGLETVPERYRNRHLYSWNPNVTLMRTNPFENERIGKLIAEKLNKAKGPGIIFLPLKGVSLLDSEGNEFWDPEADTALFQAIKKTIRSGIEVLEKPCNVNDAQFAYTVVDALLQLMEE